MFVTAIFLLTSLFIVALNKKDDFRSVFLILSFFFFAFFYVLPLAMLWGQDSVLYAGGVLYPKYTVWWSCLFAGLVFLVGFFIADFVGGCVFSYEQSPIRMADGNDIEKNNRNRGLNLFFWVGLTLYLMYLVYLISDSGRSARVYDSRAGSGSGGHLMFLLFIFFGSMKFALVFVAARTNRVFLALAILSFATFVEFFGAPGRVALLLNIAVLCILIFRLPASRAAFFGLIGISIGLPVLLAMKSIVYSIVINGALPSFSQIFSDGVDVVKLIGNFGHPVVSMLVVEDTINLIGIRYFYDYVQGALFFLKPFGLDFGNSITYYNTYSVMGVEESIIPPGYLAFGFVQLGLVGVFVAGCVFRLLGYFAAYVYRWLSLTAGEPAKFYLAFLAANTFYYGDFRIIIMNFLVPLLLVCCFVLLFSKKFKLIF